MPLLPKTKQDRHEMAMLAECLLKAANLIDAFDDGLEPVVHPCTNPYVNVEEMSARWQWSLLCLLDYFDIQTSDVRRLAHAISPATQDTLSG
jgi:hypothetical protein